jgi:uncharacterized protein (TIGR02466 family)
MLTNVPIIPNLVFKTHVPLDWPAINNKCFDLIGTSLKTEYAKSPTNGGTSFTQREQPHEWDEFSLLRSTIQDSIEQLRKEWKLVPIKFWLEKSWISWHDNGAKLEEHDHGHTMFIATYYLKKPVNSGNIEYRNPLEYHWAGYPILPPEQTLWAEVPAEAGDLLLFPGWLKHRVQPNHTNQRRIALTININSHRYQFND